MAKWKPLHAPLTRFGGGVGSYPSLCGRAMHALRNVGTVKSTCKTFSCIYRCLAVVATLVQLSHCKAWGWVRTRARFHEPGKRHTGVLSTKASINVLPLAAHPQSLVDLRPTTYSGDLSLKRRVVRRVMGDGLVLISRRWKPTYPGVINKSFY